MTSIVSGLRVGRLARTVLTLAALSGLGFGAASAVAADAAAPAAPHVAHIERQSWSFAGPLGKFDRAQLQRGYKVYTEVCSACHSMRYVSFRNLSDETGLGFSEEQVKELAKKVKVKDGPNDEGEMFDRDGRPSDRFPSPFANEQAARAANGGALPPDLSLMGKARAAHRGFPWFIFDAFTQYQEYGPDYVYGLMNGYEEGADAPTCAAGLYPNHAFIAGPCIAMPKPLNDGQVTYDDGTPGTVAQYAKDVSAFLMWAAEPKLVDRKHTGLSAMLFLLVFAGLLYFTKKKVWAHVAH